MFPRKHRRAWLAVAMTGLVVAGLALYGAGPPDSRLVAAPATLPPVEAPAVATAGALADPATPSLARPVVAGATPVSAAPAPEVALPPGVSAEQWAEARRALATHPQRDAELARIGEYLAFQSDVERFTRLRAQGKTSSPELTALARSLEARLPARLARGEMHAGEAQLLKAAVLDATEPDASLRKAALTAWSAAEAARANASSRPDPREATYQAQQDTLTAAWRQLPESERDPKQLEAQLEALRRKTFVDPAR